MAREKYIPMADRPPPDVIPLCERTDLTDEEKKKLLTIDDLYASCKGDLRDSIWAPKNFKATQANIANTSLLSKIENKGPVATSASFKQNPSVKVEAMSPHSVSPYPVKAAGAGLGSSRWYTQDTRPSPPRSGVVPALQTAASYSYNSTGPELGLGTPYRPSQDTWALPPRDASPLATQTAAAHSNPSSELPPHLRGNEQKTSPANASQLHENDQKIPINLSPHLRGMQHCPSQKQTVSQDALASTSYSGSQHVNGSPSRDTKVYQTQATSSSKQNVVEQITMQHVQTPPGPPVAENAFMAFIAKKEAEDKKKALIQAQRAPIPPTTDPAPQPAQQQRQAEAPSGIVVAAARHSHFNVDVGVQSDEAFQAFIKGSRGAANGKKYISVVPQVNSAKPSFIRVDPHATFSPFPLDKVNSQVNVAITDPVSPADNAVQESTKKGIARSSDDPSGYWPVHSANTQKTLPGLFHSDVDQPGVTNNVTSQTWALVPQEDVYSNNLDNRVSDAGVEQCSKENIRGTQGKDPALELLDWDNRWAPPPIEWEDRTSFDSAYIPDYIRQDWQPTLPSGLVEFDLDDLKFTSGDHHVIGFSLAAEPLVHEETIPDIKNSESEEKRLNQTGESAAIKYQKKSKRQAKYVEANMMNNQIRLAEIEAMVPEPHPYAPAIDIYLRPAVYADIIGIMEIYNHYVQKSIVTEDQVDMKEHNIKHVLDLLEEEKLPFIVAVKGSIPTSPVSRAKNQRGQPKTTSPEGEVIVGFALATSFGYGLNGSRDGRSRAVTDLQFYVHPEYTRKGIGRSLLDRLLQCLCHSYAAKDGYSWMNPKENPVYKPGGRNIWYRLVIQLTVQPKAKDDPENDWMESFLRNYWFDKEATLKGFARSSVLQGPAVPLDVVIFASRATSAKEFPGFL